MSAKNTSTVVDLNLQEDLAEYGILRHKAGAKTTKDNPFFGLRTSYNEYETKFGTSLKAIQESKMGIALYVPENEPFDLLITKDFNKAIKTGSEEDLRSFLRSIVDKV